MGAFGSKQWDEMIEVNKLEETVKEKPKIEKLSMRDRLRMRILNTDPRSASDGVDRTPIAVQKQGESETPQHHKLKTLAVDPRSPCGLNRTPIVVEEFGKKFSESDIQSTPLRGQIPPDLLLTPATHFPPNVGCTDTPYGYNHDEDPRSPSCLDTHPRTPITATEFNKEQPRAVLNSKLRDAVAALQERPQDAISTPPAAHDLGVCSTIPDSPTPASLDTLII